MGKLYYFCNGNGPKDVGRLETKQNKKGIVPDELPHATQHPLESCIVVPLQQHAVAARALPPIWS